MIGKNIVILLTLTAASTNTGHELGPISMADTISHVLRSESPLEVTILEQGLNENVPESGAEIKYRNNSKEENVRILHTFLKKSANVMKVVNATSNDNILGIYVEIQNVSANDIFNLHNVSVNKLNMNKDIPDIGRKYTTTNKPESVSTFSKENTTKKDHYSQRDTDKSTITSPTMPTIYNSNETSKYTTGKSSRPRPTFLQKKFGKKEQQNMETKSEINIENVTTAPIKVTDAYNKHIMNYKISDIATDSKFTDSLRLKDITEKGLLNIEQKYGMELANITIASTIDAEIIDIKKTDVERNANNSKINNEYVEPKSGIYSEKTVITPNKLESEPHKNERQHRKTTKTNLIDTITQEDEMSRENVEARSKPYLERDLLSSSTSTVLTRSDNKTIRTYETTTEPNFIASRLRKENVINLDNLSITSTTGAVTDSNKTIYGSTTELTTSAKMSPENKGKIENQRLDPNSVITLKSGTSPLSDNKNYTSEEITRKIYPFTTQALKDKKIRKNGVPEFDIGATKSDITSIRVKSGEREYETKNEITTEHLKREKEKISTSTTTNLDKVISVSFKKRPENTESKCEVKSDKDLKLENIIYSDNKNERNNVKITISDLVTSQLPKTSIKPKAAMDFDKPFKISSKNIIEDNHGIIFEVTTLRSMLTNLWPEDENKKTKLHTTNTKTNTMSNLSSEKISKMQNHRLEPDSETFIASNTSTISSCENNTKYGITTTYSNILRNIPTSDMGERDNLDHIDSIKAYITSPTVIFSDQIYDLRGEIMKNHILLTTKLPSEKEEKHDIEQMSEKDFDIVITTSTTELANENNKLKFLHTTETNNMTDPWPIDANKIENPPHELKSSISTVSTALFINYKNDTTDDITINTNSNTTEAPIGNKRLGNIEAKSKTVSDKAFIKSTTGNFIDHKYFTKEEMKTKQLSILKEINSNAKMDLYDVNTISTTEFVDKDHIGNFARTSKPTVNPSLKDPNKTENQLLGSSTPIPFPSITSTIRGYKNLTTEGITMTTIIITNQTESDEKEKENIEPKYEYDLGIASNISTTLIYRDHNYHTKDEITTTSTINTTKLQSESKKGTTISILQSEMVLDNVTVVSITQVDDKNNRSNTFSTANPMLITNRSPKGVSKVKTHRLELTPLIIIETTTLAFIDYKNDTTYTMTTNSNFEPIKFSNEEKKHDKVIPKFHIDLDNAERVPAREIIDENKNINTYKSDKVTSLPLQDLNKRDNYGYNKDFDILSNLSTVESSNNHNTTSYEIITKSYSITASVPEDSKNHYNFETKSLNSLSSSKLDSVNKMHDINWSKEKSDTTTTSISYSVEHNGKRYELATVDSHPVDYHKLVNGYIKVKEFKVLNATKTNNTLTFCVEVNHTANQHLIPPEKQWIDCTTDISLTEINTTTKNYPPFLNVTNYTVLSLDKPRIIIKTKQLNDSVASTEVDSKFNYSIRSTLSTIQEHNIPSIEQSGIESTKLAAPYLEGEGSILTVVYKDSDNVARNSMSQLIGKNYNSDKVYVSNKPTIYTTLTAKTREVVVGTQNKALDPVSANENVRTSPHMMERSIPEESSAVNFTKSDENSKKHISALPHLIISPEALFSSSLNSSEIFSTDIKTDKINNKEYTPAPNITQSIVKHDGIHGAKKYTNNIHNSDTDLNQSKNQADLVTSGVEYIGNTDIVHLDNKTKYHNSHDSENISVRGVVDSTKSDNLTFICNNTNELCKNISYQKTSLLRKEQKISADSIETSRDNRIGNDTSLNNISNPTELKGGTKPINNSITQKYNMTKAVFRNITNSIPTSPFFSGNSREISDILNQKSLDYTTLNYPALSLTEAHSDNFSKQLVSDFPLFKALSTKQDAVSSIASKLEQYPDLAHLPKTVPIMKGTSSDISTNVSIIEKVIGKFSQSIKIYTLEHIIPTAPTEKSLTNITDNLSLNKLSSDIPLKGTERKKSNAVGINKNRIKTFLNQSFVHNGNKENISEVSQQELIDRVAIIKNLNSIIANNVPKNSNKNYQTPHFDSFGVESISESSIFTYPFKRDSNERKHIGKNLFNQTDRVLKKLPLREPTNMQDSIKASVNIKEKTTATIIAESEQKTKRMSWNTPVPEKSHHDSIILNFVKTEKNLVSNHTISPDAIKNFLEPISTQSRYTPYQTATAVTVGISNLTTHKISNMQTHNYIGKNYKENYGQNYVLKSFSINGNKLTNTKLQETTIGGHTIAANEGYPNEKSIYFIKTTVSSQNTISPSRNNSENILIFSKNNNNTSRILHREMPKNYVSEVAYFSEVSPVIYVYNKSHNMSNVTKYFTIANSFSKDTVKKNENYTIPKHSNEHKAKKTSPTRLTTVWKAGPLKINTNINTALKNKFKFRKSTTIVSDKQNIIKSSKENKQLKSKKNYIKFEVEGMKTSTNINNNLRSRNAKSRVTSQAQNGQIIKLTNAERSKITHTKAISDIKIKRKTKTIETKLKINELVTTTHPTPISKLKIEKRYQLYKKSPRFPQIISKPKRKQFTATTSKPVRSTSNKPEVRSGHQTDYWRWHWAQKPLPRQYNFRAKPDLKNTKDRTKYTRRIQLYPHTSTTRRPANILRRKKQKLNDNEQDKRILNKKVQFKNRYSRSTTPYFDRPQTYHPKPMEYDRRYEERGGRLQTILRLSKMSLPDSGRTHSPYEPRTIFFLSPEAYHYFFKR